MPVERCETAALATPNRHLTIEESHERLLELWFLERASAHVLAGWIPKVPNIETKVQMGVHLGQAMANSRALRKRVEALEATHEAKGSAPRGWHDMMLAVDQAADADELLALVYGVVCPAVLDLYCKYISLADPIADAAGRRIVVGAVRDAEERLSWAAQNCISALADERRDAVVRLWEHRAEGQRLPLSALLWAPLDRVPRVARPQSFRRGREGALRLIPRDPLASATDVGLFLHNFLNEEITTLELVARNFYEHPNMPEEFHADMARHTADEARHAQLIARLAREFGVEYGDYPIYVASYEGQYEFEPCEPFSRHELLWRLLLRQTFHEGLALDSLAFEVRKREFLGQPELARVFDFLLADEVFHARSGLTWSRYLCGGDGSAATRERAVAHGYFLERMKRGRARYVAENLDEAIAEVEMLDAMPREGRLPFRRTLNTYAREQAGFSEADIEQIVGWGYVE
jgi:uncharacterized ferritin-like protein (DUF455 family)